MRLSLTIIALLLAVGSVAALTVTVRDATTNSTLNATLNVTYNQFWSYQEQANVATPNGGLSTGRYGIGNNTYFGVPTEGYFSVNYTPTNVSTGLLWQTYYGVNTTSTLPYFMNTSVPNGCFNNPVQLRFVAYAAATGALGFSYGQCYNTSLEWQNITALSRCSGFSGGTGGAYNGNTSWNDGSYNASSNTFMSISSFGPFVGRENTGSGFCGGGGGANFAGGLVNEEGVYWDHPYQNVIESSLTGVIPLVNSTYYERGNITVSVPGYTSQTATNLLFNGSEYYFNLTTSSNTTFYFYDESTNALITQPLSISLSGSIYGTNATTSNGSITFANLTNDYYTVTYSATNYTQRYFFANLPSAASATYSLFLLPASNATIVKITLLGETYQPLSNGLVTAQRKNISGTNYYAVGQCTTDNNGNCLIDLELYTATYKFVTYYGGVNRYTNDTQLSTNTFTIVINTRTSTLQDVIANSNTVSGLTYDGAGTFTFIVSDSSGGIQAGSLIVNRRYGGQYTTLGSATGSGTSFSITVGPVNTSVGDEIIASGFVNNPDGYPVLTQRVSILNTGLGSSLGAGSVLLFVGMAFTLVFIFAWNPVAPMIIFGILFLLLSRVGLVSVGAPAIASIFVIIAAGIYRMRGS